MTALRVCSPRPGDGKTTVAAGLLSLLGRRGLSGYRREGAGPDGDFLRSALGLSAAGGHEIVEGDAPRTDGPGLVVAAFRGQATVEEAGACLAGQTLGVIVNGVPAAQARS